MPGRESGIDTPGHLAGEICRRDCLSWVVLGVGYISFAGCYALTGCTRQTPPEPAKSSSSSAAPHHFRLTLRLLLAYRDKLLESADDKDVGERLRESEFASEVYAKIEAITKANADHDAIFHDKPMPEPNRVAEYLDNVLEPDAVKSFETLCLQDDAPLAEVACCHRILTEVLANPVDIDAKDYERLGVLIREKVQLQLNAAKGAGRGSR